MGVFSPVREDECVAVALLKTVQVEVSLRVDISDGSCSSWRNERILNPPPSSYLFGPMELNVQHGVLFFKSGGREAKILGVIKRKESGTSPLSLPYLPFPVHSQHLAFSLVLSHEQPKQSRVAAKPPMGDE